MSRRARFVPVATLTAPFRFSRIQFWNIFTPHLKGSIAFIASPLTLLVALWGMTGERALQLMNSQANAPIALTENDSLSDRLVEE